MNLVYQLEDKLFWIHNFLPQSFYKDLHNLVFKGHKKVSQDSSKVWEHELHDGLKPVERMDVADTFSKQYTTLLRHSPFMNIKDIKHISWVVHKMKRFSGINWHGDGGNKYAATFYLNKRWNEQWGGEFMFKDKGQAGFIPVVGNSLVICKTPLHHKVNTVLSPTIPRLTIQSFIT